MASAKRSGLETRNRERSRGASQKVPCRLFFFEGKLYKYTCLPNGLSSAPRFFTKIMKVALTHLREKAGVTISGYLDDNILVNYVNEVDAREKGVISAELFQNLGFTINVPKSVISPTITIEHLGFIIDSSVMRVSMTENKINKIISMINKTLSDGLVKLRQVASLIGKINATKPANKWAFMYTKWLEMGKNKALATQKYDYEKYMVLSERAREDLEWLLYNLPPSSAPVLFPNADYVINKDASTAGWGCFDRETGGKTGGQWDPQEQTNHINYLELKAILLDLLSFTRNRTVKHIRIMTDNTTAKACINKQGSTQSAKCNENLRSQGKSGNMHKQMTYGLLQLFVQVTKMWKQMRHLEFSMIRLSGPCTMISSRHYAIFGGSLWLTYLPLG